MANSVNSGKGSGRLGIAASPPNVQKDELGSTTGKAPSVGKLPSPSLGRSMAKGFIQDQVCQQKVSAEVLQDIHRPIQILEQQVGRGGDHWEFRTIALRPKSEQVAPALVSSFSSLEWKQPPGSMRNVALDKVQAEVTAQRGQNIFLMDVRLTQDGGRVCMLRRDDSKHLAKSHKKGKANLDQTAVKAEKKWLSLTRPEQWSGTRLAGQQRDSQLNDLLTRLNDVALASFADSYVKFVERSPSLMLDIIKAGFGKAEPDDDHPFETDKGELTGKLLESHADSKLDSKSLAKLPAQVLGDAFRRLLHSWNGQLLDASPDLLIALEAHDLQGQRLEQFGNLIDSLPPEKRDLLGVVLKSLVQYSDELSDICERLGPTLMPGFEIWDRTPARTMKFMMRNLDRLFPALPSIDQLQLDLKSTPIRFEPPDEFGQAMARETPASVAQGLPFREKS
jgi:hypothetical protein